MNRLQQLRLRAYRKLVSRVRGLFNSNIRVPLSAGTLRNRSFAPPPDGWFHIAPKGEHPHPTKVVQIIDDKSVSSMVSNFRKQAADPKFPGILVDYDHLSQNSGSTTEAAGWIRNLQKRDDGLWAKIDWSDEGEKAVNGGRFRMVSPVWKKKDCESEGRDRLRPLVLDSVALTNDPNMKGLTPLTA